MLTSLMLECYNNFDNSKREKEMTFMSYVYTVLGTTAIIVIAEIVIGYGIGDKVKDLFQSAEARAMALEAKAAKIRATL